MNDNINLEELEFTKNSLKSDRKTILIIDDEKKIVDMLVYNLQKEGYNTLIAYDGEEGLKIALQEKPNLVLLDLMLPKIDGLNVCKKIRNYMDIPILMISAKDSEIDKILGLELGADDYITKPFSVRELLARVKANLRKVEEIRQELKKQTQEEKEDEEEERNIILVGDLAIDLDNLEVRSKGKVINLTVREFDVIKYLALKKGGIVTREELLENVWGYEYIGDVRTVDVTIKRLRGKIEKDPSNPRILITKRGVGYLLDKRYFKGTI